MNHEAMRIWLAGIEDILIFFSTDEMKKNWVPIPKSKAMEVLAAPVQGVILQFYIKDWELLLGWNVFTNSYYGYIEPDQIPLGKGTFYNEAHFHNLYNLTIPTAFAKMVEALNA